MKRLKSMTAEERRRYDAAKARRHYRRHKKLVISKVKARYNAKPYWVRQAGRYGKTAEFFERLEKLQDGKCAICQQPNTRLHIDHCHKSGKVRGLLCGMCNAGIGFLKDSPELLRKAADYVQKFNC